MVSNYPAGAENSQFCPWDAPQKPRDCDTCARFEPCPCGCGMGWCHEFGEFTEADCSDECGRYE